MMPKWLRSLALLENALRCSAVVILVGGLAGSVLVWRVQDRLEHEHGGARAADDDLLVSPLEDRRQLRELELYGGKGSVLVEEVKGWFHGKALAKTIAVGSMATAAALFLVTVRRTD